MYNSNCRRYIIINFMEGIKMLTNIGKKIVISRLMDNGISMQDASNYVNNILINVDNFDDYNSMYDFIVVNYGKLIIE
jgi:hypothetical protein